MEVSTNRVDRFICLEETKLKFLDNIVLAIVNILGEHFSFEVQVDCLC